MITLVFPLIFKKSFCKSANRRVQVDRYLQKVYFVLGNAGWRTQRCSFIYSNPDVILVNDINGILFPEMSSTDELMHIKRTVKYISRGNVSSSLVTLARPSVSSSLQITNRSFTYASPYLWNQLPLFIPSTLFCLLSSWFTSSCAYHLITVTNFALITYHCLCLPLQT